MSEQRLIDANALLTQLAIDETSIRRYLSTLDANDCNNGYDIFVSTMQIGEIERFRWAIEDAPTVKERAKGERVKVYIVVKGNYALSNSMWAFSSKELADGFRKHLRKELDDGIPFNIIELEIDEAVLTEEDL